MLFSMAFCRSPLIRWTEVTGSGCCADDFETLVAAVNFSEDVNNFRPNRTKRD